MAEVIDKLMEEKEEHLGLIGLILACYLWVDKSKPEKTKKVINFFLINIAEKIGFRPELNFCVDCQKKPIPEKLFFDYSKGGLVCKSCIDQGFVQEISVNEIKILRIYLNIGKKNHINQESLEILNKIDDNLDNKIMGLLFNYFDYTTEKKFLAKVFLKKIERLGL
jgi:recombinational DNA repair protein (RecF pathway)